MFFHDLLVYDGVLKMYLSHSKQQITISLISHTRLYSPAGDRLFF